MKIALITFFALASFYANAQTDVEISNSLIHQPYAQCNAILSKMGVWYHYHYRDTKNADGNDVKPKFYSIENGNKSTKVWIIKYNKEKIIDEIIINFRHDDRRQVEDAQRLAPLVFDYHVGTYSTDIVIRSKLQVMKE